MATPEEEAAAKAVADKAKEDEGRVTLAELTKGMATLATAVEGIQQNMSKLQSQPAKREDEEENEEEDDEEVDEKTLESLPRKGFADHIIKKVSKVVEKQLKSVSKSASDVKDEVARDRVEKAVMEVAKENKDFWDWKDEIKDIADSSPGIYPRRAYQLARLENPDKAKKLNEKYKLGEKEDAGDKGSDKGGKKKFGGFTPSSGNTQQNSKMSKTEAADKAWEETMGSLGTGEGT